MKEYRELELYIHLFLISLLDGGEWSASCGTAFSPVYIGKRLPGPQIGYRRRCITLRITGVPNFVHPPKPPKF
jgi:hypothetical protein